MTSVSRHRVFQSVAIAALAVIVCVSNVNETTAEETGPISAECWLRTTDHVR